jgi:hypothetical protein
MDKFTMEKELSIRVATGIGDIILISAALNNIKHKYDKIIMRPSIWETTEYKKYTEEQYLEFRNFVFSLINLLLHDEKFVIIEHIKSEKQIQQIGFEDLCRTWLTPYLPRFANELCLHDGSLNIDSDYIVVTTKIRELGANFHALKKDFFETLNKLSSKYKIVVIGERDNTTDTGCINYYKDLIGSVKNNVIDLTVNTKNIIVPNLLQITKDCSIMNKAKYVITVGCGGNFVLALTVANNLISWKNDRYISVNKMIQGFDNFKFCNNYKDFKNCISNI